jgi:hypothetical protein
MISIRDLLHGLNEIRTAATPCLFTVLVSCVAQHDVDLLHLEVVVLKDTKPNPLCF